MPRHHAHWPPITTLWRDALALGLIGVPLAVVLAWSDLFAYLAGWLHAQALVDDVLSFVLVTLAGFAWFSWRRWRELQRATREVRLLSGMVRLCAWCRKARTDEGDWMPLEDYVRAQTAAEFSPDLCPTCQHQIPASGRRRGFF